MLNVTPLSWIRSLFMLSIGSSNIYIAWVYSAGGQTPYGFSNRPITSAKDAMRNRDCYHLQYHGDVILNDLVDQTGYTATKVTPSMTPNPFEHWWPNRATIQGRTYYWNTKVSFNTVLIHQRGSQRLSWDYVQPDTPGGVFRGVHEPYRCALGTTPAGINYLIYMEAECQLSQLLIKADFTVFQTAITEKGNAVWRAFRMPTWTFTDSQLGLELVFARSTSIGRCRYEFRVVPKTYDGSVSFWSFMEDRKMSLSTMLDNMLKQALSLVRYSSSVNSTNYTDNVITPEWSFGNYLNKPTWLSSSDLALLKRELRQYSERLLPELDFRFLLGDATQSAANAAKKFAGNMLAYQKDIRRIIKDVKAVLQTLSGKPSPKAWASLWLSYRYGIRLTIQDTLELLNGIEAAISQDGKYATCRGVSQDERTVCHAKLYYAPKELTGIMRAIHALYDWDIMPTLENLWDLVPYSFVADWFLAIGDILDGIDSIGYTQTMNVFSCVYSTKTTLDGDSLGPLLGIDGNITITLYDRSTPEEPYQYIPHFTGSLPSATNIVDGAALILQKT